MFVRPALDTALLARAMQAGAREVVAMDDLHLVAGAVSRAHSFSQALRGPEASRHNGHVISIFSPKGGVGKTTVAVNLALALTDKGARQVCLVDFDLAFGDVAITCSCSRRTPSSTRSAPRRTSTRRCSTRCSPATRTP